MLQAALRRLRGDVEVPEWGESPVKPREAPERPSGGQWVFPPNEPYLYDWRERWRLGTGVKPPELKL